MLVVTRRPQDEQCPKRYYRNNQQCVPENGSAIRPVTVMLHTKLAESHLSQIRMAQL